MNERLAELEQWEDYHEPLARIFREVKKGLPEAKKQSESVEREILHLSKEEYMMWFMKAIDAEVSDEIDRLLTQIIEEIENGMD